MSKKLTSKCIFYPCLQKIAIIFFSRFFFKDFYEYTCIFETRMTHIEFSFYPKPINCSLSQNYNSNKVALFGFLSYISGATWHYCSIYCLDFEKLDFDLTLFIIFFTLHWIFFFYFQATYMFTTVSMNLPMKPRNIHIIRWVLFFFIMVRYL